MAESEKPADLKKLLEQLRRRASEAEDRLSRLEAAVAKEKDSYEEEYLKKISKLESELECAKSELAAEHKKAGELAAENAKLKYRVTHLVQAVKEADLKLESKGI
ncbi:uncharacterized protein LOC115678532 [Syzygium oleosum]|uniref:uncharacterized protein LOC115678532 n=1 Tax=Syzygium oleosum TaxID=219896 RepID=UPI0024B88518|nr:uncharacterized protein LOC115678532 [Syzygium oleosum]